MSFLSVSYFSYFQPCFTTMFFFFIFIFSSPSLYFVFRSLSLSTLYLFHPVHWMLSKQNVLLQDYKTYQDKQTPALRQLQMKANLYTINKRRTSVNLPLRPAYFSAPPLFSLSILCLSPTTTHTHPPTHPPLSCVLPISDLAVLLGWAQRQGKLTDASIIHRSPILSLALSLSLSLSLSLFLSLSCFLSSLLSLFSSVQNPLY